MDRAGAWRMNARPAKPEPNGTRRTLLLWCSAAAMVALIATAGNSFGELRTRVGTLTAEVDLLRAQVREMSGGAVGYRNQNFVVE